jgi:hypothetical protein
MGVMVEKVYTWWRSVKNYQMSGDDTFETPVKKNIYNLHRVGKPTDVSVFYAVLVPDYI